MTDPIILHDYRKWVDSAYVGFTPNGGAIKPVHVANGIQRCIFGAYNSSDAIKRLALVTDAKGCIPQGNTNDLNTMYEELMDSDSLEDNVSATSLESMRNVMQRLLSADKGAYVVKGLKDDMISFTAGSMFFLTRTSIYEDTGEFIGGIIRTYCPALADYIRNLLNKAEDPITLLFEPVIGDSSDSMKVFEKTRHEDLPIFTSQNDKVKWYIDGVYSSGMCLLSNLEQHPNALTQLRLFNFFCIFHLLRYMVMLESFYCDEGIRPFLIDFSGKEPSQSSVARSSEIAYTQMHKAINRFYAWGYANKLKEDGYSKEDLLALDTPVYDTKKKSTSELDTLWSLAKENARICESEDEALLIFGETMYDMLALEASSHPVNCVKVLGTSSGMLYPPDRFHPNKRFVFSQDALEMVLRSAVLPNEVLSGAELRTRLWDRFGIIVGGGSEDMRRLQSSGMLLQIDEDSLAHNFDAFASVLESMDFAEEMADGILQIRLGGVN